MLVFTVWADVWLAIQLYNWWLPYLFGGERSFYEKGYADTTRFLPRIDDHQVIPDAQHVVLQLLSLLMVVTMSVALWKVWQARRRQLGRS